LNLLRQFHNDASGTEMVEFVVGATLIITISAP
jgi:Flp pilus assembly pilin Flp